MDSRFEKLTQIHKLSKGSRLFIGATVFGLLLNHSCSFLFYIVSNTLVGCPSTLPLGCHALLIISITLYGSGPLGYNSDLLGYYEDSTPLASGSRVLRPGLCCFRCPSSPLRLDSRVLWPPLLPSALTCWGEPPRACFWRLCVSH